MYLGKAFTCYTQRVDEHLYFMVKETSHIQQDNAVGRILYWIFRFSSIQGVYTLALPTTS